MIGKIHKIVFTIDRIKIQQWEWWRDCCRLYPNPNPLRPNSRYGMPYMW